LSPATTVFDRIAAMTAEQRAALSEQFAKSARLAGAEPIAVVGIGCRFPGEVHGPDDYWQLLVGGRDTITTVPADRWDAEAYYDADPSAPGRMPTKWGAFLSDVAGFDADFFGITPREAEAMDPQQRLLLEVTWEALEHAGIRPETLSETATAVMMGVYYNEYQASPNTDDISPYWATGNAHSVTVGRIAYLLGLRGPAMAFDTACSSSLVAVHEAAQSLRMRESDLALAGGVSLILRPETQLALAAWGMFSPRGRCRSFDAGADGFVRGEGAGVVVLKRLTDAVRDGDRVLSVIRGSAVNQDGRSNGLTAPNAPAQRDVITAALRSADVPAQSVALVETHGTATTLGDPIEFDALAQTYGRDPGDSAGDSAPCALGAVKTNIGHLEAAAGIAGFIKATLALQHAHIPPNLNFVDWNPAIDASNTRLFVPTANTDWPGSEGPRRAAVSSFGFGGTNAHVVLEQGPDFPATPDAAGAPVTTLSTLVVSGKTPERLADWAGVLADWIEGPGAQVPLAEVAGTLARHRARYPVLATVTAEDRAQAVEALRALSRHEPATGLVGPQQRRGGGPTVFVYSGQGSQWTGMGRRLLDDEPAFAAAVDELEPDFVAQTGFSLREALSAGEPITGIARIQPVLVGMQLALTALWRHYGVTPDAVIGHSMGEVTAAVVAGALSPADGLKVIATRSRLMSRLSGQGAMALLELDADATAALLAEHPGLTLAVYAAPRQTVIAGPQDQVQAVIEAVRAKNLLARPVEVDVASHHPLIDPVLPELRTLLADLTPTAPAIPILSTAREHDAAPVFDAGYWADNLRNPVRFHQAIAAAAQHHGVIVEVSPHPVLLHAVNDTLEYVGAAERTQVLPTLSRDTGESVFFHTQLAAIAPPPAEGGPSGRLADIPTTPWRHQRFWVAGDLGDRLPRGTHPLLGAHIELPQDGAHLWQADVGVARNPWLADHRVHGQPILPGPAFAEIVLAAAAQGLGRPVETICVRQLEIEQMLPLTDETRLITQLQADPDGSARVEVHSASGGRWLRHAVARIEAADPSAPRPALPESAGAEQVPTADYYAALRHSGQQHGPAFAGLTSVARLPGGGAVTEIALPDGTPANPAYRIHPVMLDSALQGLAAALPPELTAERADATYLPVSFDSIRLFGDVGAHALCRAEMAGLDDAGAGMLGRVDVFDVDGNPTAQISGVYVRRVERRTVPLPLSQKVFDTEWTPGVPVPQTGDAEAGAGSWLVLADSETAAAAQQLSAGLATAGRRVLTADLHDEAAVLAAFADAAADPASPPRGIVVLVGGTALDPVSAEALSRTQESIWSISAAVRAVVRGWLGESPRLWLVSTGGLAVGDGESGRPSAGALRGLVRVLAYEHPDLRTTLVDLDPAGDTAGDTAGDPAGALLTELAVPGSDDVVAWRGGRRYVERLARAALGERSRDHLVRGDGSYVVTGALGGLGLVMVRWLAERGAGRIVLNGRSEPTADARAELAAIGGQTQIEVVTGDISVPGVAESLVSAAERTGLPLRGVLHSAAVIDDALVVSMTKESLHRVWAAKAAGALHLHHATADSPLDWWVGFSSMASLLGSPGQGAYAAANAWLDALAGWRRAAGLPATSVNWGQWSEVGVAQALTMGVLDPISPAEGLEALEALLGSDTARAGVARLRLDRAAAAFPEISGLGYFASVADELDDLDGSGDWAGPQALAGLPGPEAARLVGDRLRLRVLAIMGYPGDWPLEAARPLIELGMDSLMAVRIRNTARADFGVEPPVALLLQGASLTELTRELISQLGLAAPEAEEKSAGLGARAQQRALARQGAAARRRKGPDG